MHRWLFLCLIAVARFCCPALVNGQDLDLHGTIHDKQDDSYVLVPFAVPHGVKRLEVSFRYTGHEEHTTLDLGVFDPDRFRGWSGGNKREFSIDVAAATPSYLAGPLPAGPWKLVIGVAHIESRHTSTYDAHVHFIMDRERDLAGFAPAPIAVGRRWYRGDLHMHTAHSDGSCTSQSGKQVPCPVFVTMQEAVKQKLDFIAITDHNTISHYDAERELQPYFDQLLLIPGRELTTYSGHANVFGITSFLDFRAEAKGSPSISQVFRSAKDAGALVSVNHPGDPTGPSCIGCGWSIPDTNWSLVDGVEAINGNDPQHYNGDIRFWEGLLAEGHRLVAVGGSDTHRPERGTIGHPTTVVDAPELSVTAILDAIRQGRVCVDLTASHDKVLDLQANDGEMHAAMGGRLAAARRSRVTLAAHVIGAAGSTLHWLLDGHEVPAMPSQPLSADMADQSTTWTSDGARHWLRAEVRAKDGALQILGNPVFINWP